jgi:hypothetical protein
MITIEGKIAFTERAAQVHVVIADDCVASEDRAQQAAPMLLRRHRFDLPHGEAIERAWRDNAGTLRERA